MISTAVGQNNMYRVFFLKMGELKANHEAMKLEVQSSHAEQLQCVKQHFEISLEGEWTGLTPCFQTISSYLLETDSSCD